VKKRAFIFEVSKAPHEFSIIGITKVFESIDFEVSLCLGKFPMKRLGNSLREKKERDVYFISKLFELITFLIQVKKEDVFIFNTVSFRSIFFITFVSMFSNKNIFYVRNGNSWFIYPNHSKKIFNIVFGRIITFLKKRLLKKKGSIYTVQSYNCQKYLLNHNVTKPIFVTPFNMFIEDNLELSKRDISKPFIFLVPGTIDLNRKDLSRIKDASLLFSKEERATFKVILLGYPVDEKSKEFTKGWKDQLGDSLEYWDGFIDADEFEVKLKSADVIMGSLNIHYEDRFYKEVYGQTKDTGIEAHAIAYARPLMVNEEYYNDEKINTSSVTYSDKKNCHNEMSSLINNKIRYEKLLDQALINSRNYSLDVVASKVRECLEKVK
jgi:hypothetical protein